MFSDTQTFTINGDNDKTLAKVLQLAIELDGCGIEAFYEDRSGLVFCSYKRDGAKPYPFEATVPVLVEQINQYLKKLSREDTERLAGRKPNDDGIVRLGWEVFVPKWYGGDEVENYDMADIIAVRPCWIVYGK